jgi:hypothetical protein
VGITARRAVAARNWDNSPKNDKNRQILEKAIFRLNLDSDFWTGRGKIKVGRSEPGEPFRENRGMSKTGISQKHPKKAIFGGGAKNAGFFPFSAKKWADLPFYHQNI